MMYVAKLARPLARLKHLISVFVLALAAACGGPTETSEGPGAAAGLSLIPHTVTLTAMQRVLFRASAASGRLPSNEVKWSATGGNISSEGLYTAPSEAGTYTVKAHAGSAFSSATVTVTPSPSSDAPASVDQPSGYRAFAENAFSQLPPNAGLAGAWSVTGGNLSITGDPSAPKSPGAVLEFRFPRGTSVGSSVGMLEGWDRTTDGHAVQYREVYETGWFKIPRADFETPGPGMKLLGYWGVGQAGTGKVPNQIYAVLRGNSEGTSLMSSWALDIRQQNNVDRSMPANRSTKPIRAGVWQRYAIQMVLNDVDVPNGILRVWLDNGDGTGLTLTHEYTDVEYRTSAANSADGRDSRSGFYGRRWDPIWGGIGGAAKSRADYLWVDHIYLSGKPL